MAKRLLICSQMAAQEVASVLQIAQVDFSDEEMLIVPSTVSLELEVGTTRKTQLQQLPDNGRLAWKLSVPVRQKEDIGEGIVDLMAIALTMLGQLPKSIHISLPKLLAASSSKALIKQMVAEGLLDWQVMTILANLICGWQVQQEPATVGLSPARYSLKMKDRMFRKERKSDPPFDPSMLTPDLVDIHKSMLTVAAFRTWGLHVNRQTPDFGAMKRLLDERFGHSRDDVPHEDPFPETSG